MQSHDLASILIWVVPIAVGAIAALALEPGRRRRMPGTRPYTWRLFNGCTALVQGDIRMKSYKLFLLSAIVLCAAGCGGGDEIGKCTLNCSGRTGFHFQEFVGTMDECIARAEGSSCSWEWQ
jgi:hypothetical protein